MFDTIVNISNKSLTGSFNSFKLFIVIFLISFGYLYMKNPEFNQQNIINSVKVASVFVLLNYIKGKLFQSRIRLYKRRGFTKQKAYSQAYASARHMQLMSMFV